MTFSIYVPDKVKRVAPAPPVLFYLSGLTCTDENAKQKGSFFEAASAYGLAVVSPDTSARGDDVKIDNHDDAQYDLGSGAGFYVDATEAKWSKHYNMYTYVTKELPEIVGALFDVDVTQRAITGHSMGGHGALTVHLKNPGMFKSVSAFAPICNPTQAPWG
jgi:S-formylglutathione hydrolase